ncbi:hypothetical protein RF11_09095 [Thelohanellus kitauei]|uniref:Uncharacterized protein n=1 Tax=Thelohanellus kitauei TaxID=669202 RepID=A0A0C2J8G2_THEKT|nr:hypothetical protein RF11_09095 [Thelohanellus kitauei]
MSSENHTFTEDSVYFIHVNLRIYGVKIYLSDFKQDIMIELKMNKEEPYQLRISEIIYFLLSKNHRGHFAEPLATYKNSYDNLVLCYTNHTYVYRDKRFTNFHKKNEVLKIDAQMKSLTIDLFQTRNQELIENHKNTRVYRYNITQIAAEKASRRQDTTMKTSTTQNNWTVRRAILTTVTKIYMEDNKTVNTEITGSPDIRRGRSRRQAEVEDIRLNKSNQIVHSQSKIGYLGIAGVILFISLPAYKYYKKKRYRHIQFKLERCEQTPQEISIPNNL